MKVCMVGVFNYYSDGRVKGYAESLKQAGIEVHVLSLHGSVRNQCLEKNGIRVFNMPLRRARKNAFTYSLEYGFAFLFLIIFVTKLFLSEHYDIIHVHNMPDFLVFTCLLPKLFGAKIILDIHDPMPEVYSSKFPKAKNGLGMRLMRFEEKVSTGFVDAIVTANARFRETLIKRGIPASKITVVNNYPNPNIFDRSAHPAQKGKPEERFILIFPGTIAPRYGLEVAIRALPLLKGKIQNIRLLIVGKQDEYSKSLISLANQQGVASIVEFRAQVPQEEVPGLLVQADVGIYPALPDPHMSIATPTKLLEFAAMGLPILTSRLDIVEEMFDKSAVMFFEPGDANHFAQCALRLYEEPELRKELVNNTDRTFVQKRSWAQEFSTYLSVLDSLLPGSINH
jgi:glycosyltransferase involved in cell wall biosynthesis